MNAQTRLELCRKCPKRNRQSCTAASDGVDNLTIRSNNPQLDCPLGLWGKSETKSSKPTMAWFVGDIAKGGISNYMRTIIPELHKAGYKHEGIVLGSNIDLDLQTVEVLANICPLYVIRNQYGNPHPNVMHVPETIYEQLLNAAEVVQLAGNLPEHTPFPEGLSWDKATVFTQAHGVCDWTLKVIKHSMQYATRIIAVSQAVKSNLIQHGFRAQDIYVVRSVIDRNRLTNYYSQEDARSLFLDKNSNNKYELKHEDALNGLWLTYYGRLSPEKGIYRISQAVAAFQRFCADSKGLPTWQQRWFDRVSLLVVGGGLQAVETTAELMRINPSRTILCDWSDSPADVLAASDMTLCMSDNEGGPLTVPESIMGCCPAASYQIGVVPELVYSTAKDYRLLYTPLTNHADADVTARELYAALVNRKPGYRSSSDYRAAEECSRMFSLRNAMAAWGKAFS